MTNETWKPVVGYEGLYEVSDLGRLKSLGKRFAGDRNEARIRRIKAHPSGYLRVTLVKDGRRKTYGVHRLLLVAFRGPPSSETIEPRHLDGNRANNILPNLVWGTKAENYDDRRRHGTHNDGERHGRAKLTEASVKEIRAKYRTGRFLQKALAAEYGIVQSKISAVIRRATWDHVL